MRSVVDKRWNAKSDFEFGMGRLAHSETKSPERGSKSPMALRQTAKAKLSDVIDNEILPRMVVSHLAEAGSGRWMRAGLQAELMSHVSEFAKIVVECDAAAVTDYVARMRVRGATVEDIFTSLIAPTARRLGALWDADVYDFVQVTRGVGQLQQVVRSYGSAFCVEAAILPCTRRALLAVLPGERHTLGLSLIRECFCRDGWSVDLVLPREVDEIVISVGQQRFDVVGLSASVLPDAQASAQNIRRIRQNSRNKGLFVLVGGQAFAQRPDLVRDIGADALAADGRHAVALATAALSQASRKHGRASEVSGSGGRDGI